MEKSLFVGKNWTQLKWLEQVNSGKGAFANNRYPRSSTSYDEFSPGYHNARKIIRAYSWYDVAPYSVSLWPHRIAESSYCGRWWYRRCNSQTLSLELILDGEIVYEFNHQKLTLTSGMIFLTHPGDSVLMSSGKSEFCRLIQLCVSGAMVKLALESLGLAECRSLSLTEPEESGRIRAMLDGFFPLFADRSSESAKQNALAGFELLLTLAECFSRRNDAKCPQLLTNAILMIESGHTSSFSIQKLAWELKIGRSTLNRLFHAYLGMSPHAYWTRIRMERAKQLILEGRHSIKEIADLLGISNPFYFSTAFRRYVGMSPSQYRKELRG